MKPEIYNLPEDWAPYLINDDTSAMTDKEIEEVNLFLESNKLDMPVCCSEVPEFKWRNDANSLGGNVLEYTFLIKG